MIFRVHSADRRPLLVARRADRQVLNSLLLGTKVRVRGPNRPSSKEMAPRFSEADAVPLPRGILADGGFQLEVPIGRWMRLLSH